MNKTFIMFICLMTSLMSLAIEEPDNGGTKQGIDLTQTHVPKPQIMVDDPVAEYNTATGALTITLDAVYYSDYVITIEGYYATQDYFPTSSVVVIPAYALSEITYIYIDSDDCGAYEGVLDMNAITTTY